MGSSHKIAYIVKIILGKKEKKLLNSFWAMLQSTYLVENFLFQTAQKDP